MLAHLLAPILARRGIHYAWVMVALTFATAVTTAAAMSVPGVLLRPLSEEFGWSIGEISAAMATRLVLFGLIAPFAAALMLRYGLRSVVVVAAVLIVAGLAYATQMQAKWQLWLTIGLVLGAASGMTAMVLGATVASRWFTARRGLVMGMMAAAVATGQLIFLPAAAWLGEHWGWRAAVLPGVIGCAICAVAYVLLARDYPADIGLPPYGERDIVHPPRGSAGGAVALSLRTLMEASRNRTFWVLFGTFFVCGLSTNGLVQQHFIPLCGDFGLDAVTAASVLALMGVFDFMGTIGSGWLSDRWDSRWLLFWYYGLRGLSLMWLPFSTFSFWGLSVFAVFFGLDFVATVPPTVKLAAQGFGRDRGPVVFGWVFTGHQLGAATAAFAAGVSRDALNSYLPAFFTAGAICVLAAFAVITLRPAPKPAVLPAE